MPLGESMISSLKSNKSITLDKSSRFKKTLGGYGKNRKHEFNFPDASPQLLERIRLKAKKEHKRKQLIFTVFFVLLFIISVISVFYFNII
ncbi:hypothetical protein [uncultured Psychroserpens sp.]|uniref:hypothetical protein n=1 Tax=uncultured Psychroserpens sp. TaxID=255436 RepID=UPI00261C9A28|nr:hypothetical protein [uncultured Psychroserpens sp.]